MDFSNIKNFLFGYYYQCVWDFFATDIDIWKAFGQEANLLSKIDVLEDINKLLSLSDKQEIHYILNNYAEDAGGLSFDTPEESLSFLINLKTFLENSING